MNIAFVTPVNFRCRDVESILLKALAEGHQTHLILFNEKGSMGKALEDRGVNVHTFRLSDSKLKMLRQILFMISFCHRNNIDVVLSHLEPTNFVSVIAQYFIRAKVFIYRHHVDLAQLSGFASSWTYRFTYRHTRHIIAVSAAAKKNMIEFENVEPEKIHHIDLGYDFDLYKLPEPEKILQTRERLAAGKDFVLITVGRLDQFKRPQVALETLRVLVHEKKISATLVFLGDGPLRSVVEKTAVEFNLLDRVKFEGFVEDSLLALAAADFLVHPSISEASSVVVKEAALVGVPVIVVRNVGDFDEYIHHQENGFLVNRETFAHEAATIIAEYSNTKESRLAVGLKLKGSILQRHSIEASWRKLKTAIG